MALQHHRSKPLPNSSGKLARYYWARCHDPEDLGGGAPQVQVVDMSQFKAGRSVFSSALALALQETAERGEKSVLLIIVEDLQTF